jgi:hypothetical protein
MLRMIQENLMDQIATRFGYATPPDPTRTGSPPRDVLFCPPENALRVRMEQSSELDRTPEVHLPFVSFWRTSGREDKRRLNVPLATRGAPIDDTYTRRYGLRPVNLIYRIDHWSKDHPVHEVAFEDWLRWTMPLPVVDFVDGNGVQFELPTTVTDPEDTSRIAEIYEIGELYRWSFTMVVAGFVVTDSGVDSYVPIEKVVWDVFEGTPDESALIKSKEVV